MAEMLSEAPSLPGDSRDPVFLLMVSGQIQSGEFPDFDELYCNYLFVHGQDWDVTSGLSEGITQTTKRGNGPETCFVWNFPIDVTFKSTNPFGWPQIIVSVFGASAFGGDVVRGYGATHLPITSGRHSLDIAMFVPNPSSQIQKLLSWFSGQHAEFHDAKFVAEGDGREVTRVSSQGHIKMEVNIVTKNMWTQGYQNGGLSPSQGRMSHVKKTSATGLLTSME